jgi:hypothetical protein
MGANWLGECNIIGCRARVDVKVSEYLYCHPHGVDQIRMREVRAVSDRDRVLAVALFPERDTPP